MLNVIRRIGDFGAGMDILPYGFQNIR